MPAGSRRYSSGALPSSAKGDHDVSPTIGHPREGIGRTHQISVPRDIAIGHRASPLGVQIVRDREIQHGINHMLVLPLSDLLHRQPLILLFEVRPAHLTGNEFGLIALRSNHVYPSSGRAAAVSPTSIGADSPGRGSWKDGITYLANSSME